MSEGTSHWVDNLAKEEVRNLLLYKRHQDMFWRAEISFGGLIMGHMMVDSKCSGHYGYYGYKQGRNYSTLTFSSRPCAAQ